MQSDDVYFKSALNAAATRTYRTAVRFGLSGAEREDWQQELMLDLIEHAGRFNPAKASAGTFTGLVSQHRSIELLDLLIKDRSRLSFFDHDVANDDSAEADPDPYDEHVVPLWADSHSLLQETDALHDLESAIAYMSQDQLTLFSQVNSHEDLPSACGASGLSPAAFYRRVAELRMHLRMFGITTAARRPHLPEKNHTSPGMNLYTPANLMRPLTMETL